MDSVATLCDAAFGDPMVSQHVGTGSFNSPFRFNAKEFDEETGNYYYGARYYQPKSSVWMGVDALATSYPGMNPYNFTLGNPIMAIDPDGMAADSIYDQDKYGNFHARTTDSPDGGTEVDTWNYNNGTTVVHNKKEGTIVRYDLPMESRIENRAKERPLELYSFDDVIDASERYEPSLRVVKDEVYNRLSLTDIVVELGIDIILGKAQIPINPGIDVNQIANDKVDYAIRNGLEQLGVGSAVLVPTIDVSYGVRTILKIEQIQFIGYDRFQKRMFSRCDLNFDHE